MSTQTQRRRPLKIPVLCGLAILAAWATYRARQTEPAHLDFHPVRIRQAHVRGYRAQFKPGRNRRIDVRGIHLSPKHHAVRIGTNPDKEKLQSLIPTAWLVLNGGFYTPDFTPTGLLHNEDQTLFPFVSRGGAAGSGVLTITSTGSVQLHDRPSFRGELANVVFALQAGPRILEVGATRGIRNDDERSANRTTIGRDRSGWFVVLIARGSGTAQKGPTLHELQEWVLTQLNPQLGEHAIDALLNLDGGPSTGVSLRDQDASLSWNEQRAVLSFLYVKAR